MRPESIHFTGYEIDPHEFPRNRFHPGPYPTSWTRLLITYKTGETRPLVDWLIDNIDGRFGFLVSYPHVAIFFEKEMDAIVFRLKDGDNAFSEEDH